MIYDFLLCDLNVRFSPIVGALKSVFGEQLARLTLRVAHFHSNAQECTHIP